MDERRFTISDAVGYGWDAMKNNMGYLVLVVLIAWVAGGIPSGLQSLASNGRLFWLSTILGLISLAVSVFIGIAFTRIGLKLTAGEQCDYEDLYNGYPLFWNYLAGTILYGLIVLGGLILLIVPGIYWGIKYAFYGYFIVDQEMGPIEALRQSGKITYGDKWYLLGFWIVMFGVWLIGVILCGVGLLFAIPIILVATAYVFRKLASSVPASSSAPSDAAQA